MNFIKLETPKDTMKKINADLKSVRSQGKEKWSDEDSAYQGGHTGVGPGSVMETTLLMVLMVLLLFWISSYKHCDSF